MLQQGVFQNHQTTKKFVKVCLHSGQAVQMSLQFDDFFIFSYFFFQNEQLEEIDDIIEMKVGHRKNIKRRQDRFGYVSNSLIGLDINTSVVQMDEDEENPFENA